jgi:hypothetical protein
MALKLMYITNNPDVALIAEKYGVDRVWVDLETIDKAERQHNMDTVKSQHQISDIAKIKPLLTKAEMLVRVNHLYPGSQQEIDQVIAAGADIIMLPMWKTPEDLETFVKMVGGRAKTMPLLETKEAAECLEEALKVPGIDMMHIGLNDLHLSYHLPFMFQLLSNGTVEHLCSLIKKAGIPYGFGGIAKLGEGLLPCEMVLQEHYRLGSSMAILSRSFCDCSKVVDLKEIESIFKKNLTDLREYEKYAASRTKEEYAANEVEVKEKVDQIVALLAKKA